MKITWLEENKLCAGGIPVGIEDVQSLYDQGVRAIVTLTEHPLTTQKALPWEVFAPLGIKLLHVPIIDQDAPNRDQVEQITAYIENMQQPVYVHCAAGIGRTGTVLHAYYLLTGSTLAEARARVRQLRPASQYFMLSDPQKEFLEMLAETLKP